MGEKVEISMVQMLSLLKEGYSFADMQGIDPDKLEPVYALAYQYYNSDSIEDAAKLFRGLCLYQPSEQKYFMGLAACEQKLKHYTQAADLYSVCCVLSGLKDPQPMYYAAVCLLKAGKRDEAITALQSLSIMGREGDKAEQDAEFLHKGKELLAILGASEQADSAAQN